MTRGWVHRLEIESGRKNDIKTIYKTNDLTFYTTFVWVTAEDCMHVYVMMREPVYAYVASIDVTAESLPFTAKRSRCEHGLVFDNVCGFAVCSARAHGTEYSRTNLTTKVTVTEM